MPTITEMYFVGADFKYIPNSNTFRLGNKYGVLQPGDKLMACEPSSVHGDTQLGELTVKAVHVMRLMPALDLFAMFNHGVLEWMSDGRVVYHQEMINHLTAILSSVYPDQLITNETVFTVIEFE